MPWRMLVFVARRRAGAALGGRRGPAAVLLAVGLLGAASTAALAARREVTLTVRVDDPRLVYAVEVDSDCCRLAYTPVDGPSHAATFVLQRGDYTVLAVPSVDGRMVGWTVSAMPVHLDGDRAVDLSSTYQGMPYPLHDRPPDPIRDPALGAAPHPLAPSPARGGGTRPGARRQ